MQALSFSCRNFLNLAAIPILSTSLSSLFGADVVLGHDDSGVAKLIHSLSNVAS
ncbi:hypothetical protein D9M71_727970 [compost metagenome]